MSWETAVREKLKALVGFVGASGSGKTFSALLMAKGMIQEMYPDLDPTSKEFWAKIGVIDTEHGRSKIYADTTKHGHYIGNFRHIDISAPYTVEKYIVGLESAPKHGIEVVITDSATHAWKELLAMQKQLGGRYQDWKVPDEKYQHFIEVLTHSDIHVITTTRAKQKYALEASETEKLRVTKLGEQPIQRDDFEYEFLLQFLVDENHHVRTTKDNTPLFEEKGSFQITPEHGQELIRWLDKGIDVQAEKRIELLAEIDQLKDRNKEVAEAVIQNIEKIMKDKEGYEDMHSFKNGYLELLIKRIREGIVKEEMQAKKTGTK